MFYDSPALAAALACANRKNGLKASHTTFQFVPCLKAFRILLRWGWTKAPSTKGCYTKKWTKKYARGTPFEIPVLPGYKANCCNLARKKGEDAVMTRIQIVGPMEARGMTRGHLYTLPQRALRGSGVGYETITSDTTRVYVKEEKRVIKIGSMTWP